MSDTNQAQNPWFGISMGLIGVIIGYGLAMSAGGVDSGSLAGEVAKAPTPPPAAAPTPPPPPAAKDVQKVDPKEDHIRGDKDATISVIEYSDFECPFCARHHPTMQKVIDEVDDVNWVYRHYPLSFHQNAQKAAEASECAGEQGKFWEFADLVIEKLAKGDMSEYAVTVGLNKAEFEKCLDSGKYTQKVKDQMAGGSASGVRGTPGNIVLNNKTGKSQLVSGAQGVDAFKTAIEALR